MSESSSERVDAPGPWKFPVGSPESRAAARAMLERQPHFVVDFGTLPIPDEFLPSYEELLGGHDRHGLHWKDCGERYVGEVTRNGTLCRCAILKDSDSFRRIKARAETGEVTEIVRGGA